MRFPWPPNGSNSFASVIGLEVDYTNVAHTITGPMKIDVTGGYEQCIGKCFSINSPVSILKISKNLLAQADHHIGATNFGQINVSGVNFERGGQNAGLFNVALQNTSGKGVFAVGDNTADGNSPFLFGSGAIEGSVGINGWRRRYPAADGSGTVYNGYVNLGGASDGSLVQVQSQRRFQYGGTTDANGRVTIPHLLGSPGPTHVSVEMNGTAANAGWRCAVISVDATNIIVGNFLASGSALGSGASVTMYVML